MASRIARLNEKKLQVTAQPVDMRVKPMQKAVQGAPQGQNGLQQIASALGQISPAVNKFFDNQYDNQIEQYDLDAQDEVAKLPFDKQTREFSGEIISDNNNPSYVKSVNHWKAVKVAQMMRRDASLRWAGIGTNEAKDNAFNPDRDDPEDVIKQLRGEYTPEDASPEFRQVLNAELAKTHKAGVEFFIQSRYASHTTQKNDLGFNTVHKQAIDESTGEFLDGVEAAKNIVMGKDQMLMDGFTDKDWWDHTTSVLAMETEQGQREIVLALASTESREGFTFGNDPKYLGDIKRLLSYAKVRKEELSTLDQHITKLQDEKDESFGTTTLLDVQAKFEDGGYEDQEEAKEAASRVVNKIARKNASEAAQTAKIIRGNKDDTYKDKFVENVANALLSGEDNRQSSFLYGQPEGTNKMHRKNPETSSNVPFNIKDTKRRALNHAVNTITKNADKRMPSQMSPQEIVDFQSSVNHQILDVVHASGETYGGWKVGFQILAKDLSNANLQQSTITPQMYGRIKTALFIRRENLEIFNEHVSSSGLKTFLEHLQGRINATGIVASDSESFTSLVFETKEQLKQIDEATRGAVDMPSKVVNSLRDALQEKGYSLTAANQAINEGSRNYAGNPNMTADEKAAGILQTASERTHQLDNGSMIFKTQADDHTFRQAFKKRSGNLNVNVTLNDAVETFPEAIRNLRPDLYGKALEMRSWPNHKGKWYLAYADKAGSAAVKVGNVAITHTAETLANWAADRETRQDALNTIDHFMYQQSMEGVADLADVPEIHETRQLELLSKPMKEWPKDLIAEYERSVTKAKDDLQEELEETLRNIAEGERIMSMSPEDRKIAIEKMF